MDAVHFSLCLQQFCFEGHCIELFVPESKELQERYRQGNTHFPYWGQVWPAAQALTAFLFDHPHFIQNKKVLELAAGLGLPSLAAARYARTVLCSDYLPEAVAVIKKSAAHNALQNFSVQLLNWQALPHNLEADVLLLSDINYEPSAFDLQRQLIQQFLQRRHHIFEHAATPIRQNIYYTPSVLLPAARTGDCAARCKRSHDKHTRPKAARQSSVSRSLKRHGFSYPEVSIFCRAPMSLLNGFL